jgi:hypothetical protein
MVTKNKKKKYSSNCETCVYYDYDEATESYECRLNLDEDEMIKFLSDTCSNCPYYEFHDEYKTVQKQI